MRSRMENTRRTRTTYQHIPLVATRHNTVKETKKMARKISTFKFDGKTVNVHVSRQGVTFETVEENKTTRVSYKWHEFAKKGLI